MGCEDHILTDCDLEKIDECFNEVVSNPETGCIRLTRKKRIQLKEDKPFSYIVKPYPYYVSLQPTIWKKSYLENIIRPGELSGRAKTPGNLRQTLPGGRWK